MSNTANTKRIMLYVSLFVAAALSLFGMASSSCSVATTDKTAVVTTSNIVADWVRQVGGDRVEVFALMPVGGDPHTFQPGPQDIARVAQADLVFAVGLGLERGWLNKLLDNAAAEPGRVIALGDYVDPVAVAEAGQGEEDHGPFDPHFWWDPVRVKAAVNEISKRLSTTDPEGAGIYSSNTGKYLESLDVLHANITKNVEQIPSSRRILVTSHETMDYFAARYGFNTIGAVFPGITTEREPSPSELAALIGQVREFEVPAIFTETTVSDRLSRTVAAETGTKIVKLFSDSLGAAGSGADSYTGMMEVNLKLIVDALE